MNSLLFYNVVSNIILWDGGRNKHYCGLYSVSLIGVWLLGLRSTREDWLKNCLPYPAFLPILKHTGLHPSLYASTKFTAHRANILPITPHRVHKW